MIIDLLTRAKIVARQPVDREDEFHKEFGFWPSEMDFVSGYEAACLHLIAIGMDEMLPFVSTNPELYAKGVKHYTHAASLAKEFNGNVLVSLPDLRDFQKFIDEHFSEPKTVVWKILQPIVELFW